MEGAESLISVGRIGRPHGIRGEVKVIPLTDWPEKYEEFRSVYMGLEGENGEWSLRGAADAKVYADSYKDDKEYNKKIRQSFEWMWLDAKFKDLYPNYTQAS